MDNKNILRNRRTQVQRPKTFDVPKSENDNATKQSQKGGSILQSNSYWLTRIVFLRSISFIYFVAFLIAFNQNKELIGEKGLTPANIFLDRVKQRHNGKVNIELLAQVPTLLWYVDYHKHLDVALDAISGAGMLLSLFVLVRGAANMLVMLVLWILYHSLVNVGQRWYGFGWETQLLETGFLAVLFCPLLSLAKLPRRTPTPWVAIWGGRWLIFRIMVGAGLIKIRGDKCWRDLTCMNYHYLTQPVPNPIAYFMHHEPDSFHAFEVLVNHFVELVAPLLLLPLLPRACAIGGGLIQILFQAVLIISGNLSFLNWLTMLPSICCLDDRFLSFMFSSGRRGSIRAIRQFEAEEKQRGRRTKSWGQSVRWLFNLSAAVLVAYLSVPVVQNLLSSRQAMNTSFDPLRLVNTYGAFGSVTKERTEIVLQGTSEVNADGSAQWLEYEFNCKPGDPRRRPCLISPYHYRLDWLMWFAAFQSYQQNDWLVHLMAKLLTNDQTATRLLARNPFHGKPPPRFIRAVHYRYEYAPIGGEEARQGHWWKRRRFADYVPQVDLNALKPLLRASGWPVLT